MNKANIKKWLLFKLMAVFTMAVSIAFIYLIYYLAVTYDTKSLINQGDIIQYNGKVIISLCGIPFFLWMFFFALRLLLKPDAGPLEKSTYIGNVWGLLSLGAIFVGFIASFIIPFILMASPYTSCDVGTRSTYYVIRPELCETIIVDHGVKKRKKPVEVPNIK